MVLDLRTSIPNHYTTRESENSLEARARNVDSESIRSQENIKIRNPKSPS